MSGTKVEDPAPPAGEAAAAAEHLPALEPGDQHKLVGRRDVKSFILYFLEVQDS
jgi:hypothetical protein